MNERIKQLALQAGMLYSLDSKPTHIDENGTHTFQEINVYKNFDPEKFAELIIRECAKIAVEHEEYCEIKMMPTYAIDMHILEQFGVEE